MKNKIVGGIIIGFAIIIGIIILMFNKALKEIVASACTHGNTCPMWGTIQLQTNIGLLVMSLTVLIGIYLVFFADNKIIRKKYDLTNEEKKIVRKLRQSEGTSFQSELVEKLELNKVKVSRLLDKLEGKGIIERKRRGMTNVVILKE